MKAIRQFFLFATFFIFFQQVNAQDFNRSLDLKGFSKDQTFDHLKQFAVENNYFINQLDREEGFIQLGYISKTNNLFRNDYKLAINVFLNAESETDSKITLQINIKKARTQNFITTYEDEGVLKSKKGYSDLLSLINEYFNRIKK